MRRSLLLAVVLVLTVAVAGMPSAPAAGRPRAQALRFGVYPGNTFTFLSRAIPRAGNRCAGPIDTNSDGVLDTFLNCSPGATPRFEIQITNPAYPNNVALNPADRSVRVAVKVISLVGASCTKYQENATQKVSIRLECIPQ